MAKPGFWNDNRFRAYPFLRGEIGASGTGDVDNMPWDVIVDAGFTMGLDSGYVEGEHSVWLSEISRSGTTLTFEFQSDAPGLAGSPLVFTRDTADDEYTLEYVDQLEEAYSESSSFSYSGQDVCDTQPLWSGFLVTGRFDDFAIGDGETWTGSTATVEPATVVSLVNSFVDAVNVGNADRTRVDAADGCPEIEWAYPVGEDVVHIQQTCLTGDIRFKAGYNSEIEQIDNQNQLIFGADVGAGEGEPCDEIPIFPGETPPDGSTLYEGGPRCNEVLRSINGMGGQLLRLLSGTGLDITEVPAENKLIMNFDMRGLAVCYNDVSEASEAV